MANPTTNYGFVLPTSSDLVTDLPADFDVALQGVDTRLKALQPGTTLGDLAYSSATANTNTRLGIGSSGQVLTVAGGVPTWAAAGGGAVVQVKQAITTTSATSTSSTYADTNLTVSITPTSASNKILVFVNQSAEAEFNSAVWEVGVLIKLVRGSTDIYNAGQFGFYTQKDTSGKNVLRQFVNFVYLDSPATTSALTYKTQFRFYTGTTSVQPFSMPSTITVMEVTP
jgi:hypothetical protein